MQITFNAVKRVEKGTGASRRLRHAGKIPGIIYGGDKAPVQVEFDHNELFHLLRKEAFHASVLIANLGTEKETVVLRDAQWHAFRQQVLHLDFQRVDATQKMHLKVPLHFINADIAPGVKLSGGVVTHVTTEIDIECLPANLPEYLVVDLKDLATGISMHASDLTLPEGVSLVVHGDPVIATIQKSKGAAAAEDEAEAPKA